MDGLNKGADDSLGKGYLRQREELVGKHRGTKANDTVRELKAIPHSKRGGDEKKLVMVGDEQGELNCGQIIKGLVYFPKSLVFICSFVFTVLNNIEEKQKGTIRKIHCF